MSVTTTTTATATATATAANVFSGTSSTFTATNATMSPSAGSTMPPAAQQPQLQLQSSGSSEVIEMKRADSDPYDSSDHEAETEMRKLKAGAANRGNGGGNNGNTGNTSNSRGKIDTTHVFAQETNCCTLYANVKGYVVVDGAKGGGMFLRSVTKLFRTKSFIKNRPWGAIVRQIRQYTKEAATFIGKTFDITQLVEECSTLERGLKFFDINDNINDESLDNSIDGMNINRLNLNNDSFDTVKLGPPGVGVMDIADIYDEQLQQQLQLQQQQLQRGKHNQVNSSDMRVKYFLQTLYRQTSRKSEFDIDGLCEQVTIHNLSKNKCKIAIMIENEESNEDRTKIFNDVLKEFRLDKCNDKNDKNSSKMHMLVWTILSSTPRVA